MKKLILFAAFAISILAASCGDSDDAPVKKNYYGVEPVNHGVSKNAYIALFGSIVVLGGLIVYGVNKLKKK